MDKYIEYICIKVVSKSFCFLKIRESSNVIGINSLLLGFAVNEIRELTGKTEEEILDKLGATVTKMYNHEPLMVKKIGLKMLSTQKPPSQGLAIMEIEVTGKEPNED